MGTRAASISAKNISTFVNAAVKSVLEGNQDLTTGPRRIIDKGSTMGYIIREQLSTARSLEVAAAITKGVSAQAKTAGVAGLKLNPVVINRPGTILAGFIAAEANINIRL